MKAEFIKRALTVDRATRGTWMSYAALPEEMPGDEIKRMSGEKARASPILTFSTSG